MVKNNEVNSLISRSNGKLSKNPSILYSKLLQINYTSYFNVKSARLSEVPALRAIKVSNNKVID